MGVVNKITKLATFSLLMCSAAFLVVACGKQSNSANNSNDVKIANVPSPQTCLSGSTITPSSGSWGTYETSGFLPVSWNSYGYGGYGAGAYAYFGVYPYIGYGYGYGYAEYGYPTYGTNPWPNGTPYGYNGGVYNSGGYYGGGTISGGGTINGGVSQSCSCPSGTMPACDSTGLTCVSVYELQGLGRNVAIYNYNGGSFVFDNYYGASNWQTGASSACRIAQSCVVGTSSCGYGTCRPVRAGGTVGICTN